MALQLSAATTRRAIYCCVPLQNSASLAGPAQGFPTRWWGLSAPVETKGEEELEEEDDVKKEE